MEKVKVVIPMYKPRLEPLEKIALDRAVEILGRYPLVVVKPRSLDLSAVLAEYPMLTTLDFDDFYFKGIIGYNSLMLSRDFYATFVDNTEYILIYQLDAYVFEDQLEEWCDKGYDYVGAPWLERPLYKLPIISYIRRVRYDYCIDQGIACEQDLYDRVGNGGFSLRKVASCIRVLERYDDEASFYARCGKPLFNEDVYFALEPVDFKYPTPLEALGFSFDKYPRYCYKLTGHRLPFGCHGWYKWKWRGFWRKFISF